MHWQKLAGQLIRVRRGLLTQRNLSSALGYKSNAVFAWENLHDEPSARAFFRLAVETGPVGTLSPFLADESVRDLRVEDLVLRENIAPLCRSLAAGSKVTDLAKLLGRDRHAVGRWLRGQTEINLADLLKLIDVTTGRLHDFLAAFVDPERLDETKENSRRVIASRNAAKKMPWARALLALSRLPTYDELATHPNGWFAERLGISLEEEQRTLDSLLASGDLHQDGCKYRASETDSGDFDDPEIERNVASFWLREGARRLERAESSPHQHLTLALTEKDLIEAEALQKKYIEGLRALSERTTAGDTLTVATLQLLALRKAP